MTVLSFLNLLVLASSIQAVSCFSSQSSKLLLHQHPTNNKRSTTTTQLHSSSFNLNFLETLFSPLNNINKSQQQQQQQLQEIQSLKQQLYTICQTNYGKNTPSIRQDIESLITQLQPYNNNTPTTFKLLQSKWIVLWTSEKEINFFIEKGICTTQITQTLYYSNKEDEDDDGNTNMMLQNWIPFSSSSGFGVTGTIIQPAASIASDNNKNNILRTEFNFTSAKLDIGKWGTYNFPPIGSGWFDTVYLDEELRIDLNSRNDILICRRGESRDKI